MKENKVIVAIILGSLFIAVAVYISRQPITSAPLGSQENTQQEQVKQSNSEVKVTNLHTQMLPSLPAHDLYCIPSKKSYCSLEGCENVEPNVFILLGKTQKEDGLFLARCDNKPCDIYDVNLLQSGEFTTFETKEPHGILFRTSNLDQSFIEVVTLGTESFVSSGHCYSK